MNEIILEFAVPLSIGLVGYLIIQYLEYRRERRAAVASQKQPGQPYAGLDTIKREDRIHKLDDTLPDPRYDA